MTKAESRNAACIVTRLSFLPNRVATVGNIMKIPWRTLPLRCSCCFSFEQVTRREITREVLSRCAIGSVRQRRGKLARGREPSKLAR